MANQIVLLALMGLGMVVGYAIQIAMEALKKMEVPFVGVNALQFVFETLYFASILCAPVSGNVIVSLLILAVFLYALYGSFGGEKLPPYKSEDRVDSKWFPKYP